MEHDIYDSLRHTVTFCEQLADALNAIAEWCEKVTAHLMDLFEEIKGAAIEDDSTEAAS